jgi:hypothetical protein
MESFEVIARPRFDKADLTWITDIRARRAGSRGAPYFTMVFGGGDLTLARFTDVIRTQAKGVAPIRFRLRSALVVPEAVVGRFHVFLIPDEGFGAILKLHDLLHAGLAVGILRQDSPYLPHITVATTTDHAKARDLAVALNNRDIDVQGHIEALQVERRDGEVVTLAAEIPLAKGGWFG